MRANRVGTWLGVGVGVGAGAGVGAGVRLLGVRDGVQARVRVFMVRGGSAPRAPERRRVSLASRRGGREEPRRAMTPMDAWRPRNELLSEQKSSTLSPPTPDARGGGGAASST